MNQPGNHPVGHAMQHRCMARMDQLLSLYAFVEAFGQHHTLPAATAARLMLVLEELFTNTVMHGHGGDSDAPIDLWLQLAESTIVLRYEDQAPPFDPVAHLPVTTAERDGPTEDRPVGHLGLVLVLEMASHAHYELADGRNRLTLHLSAGG